MSKVVVLFIIFGVVAPVMTSCAPDQKVSFSDKLLLELPADPTAFQSKFGGTSKASVPSATAQKGDGVETATVESSGFRATFRKLKVYELVRVALKDNSLTVGSVPLIGKSSREIMKIFGPPTNADSASLVYEDKETELVLGLRGDSVVSAIWGQIP